MTADLVATDLWLRYGGLDAFRDVSFTVEAGSRTAFIGPNGAGKSSLFNVLSGMTRPTGGTVTLAGETITGRTPAQLAAAGMARTFQEGGLFAGMTVLENVMAGGHLDMRGGVLAGALWWGRAAREDRRLRGLALDELDRFGLRQLADEPVSVLPYGTQKLVELARALMRRPRVLLLDEPVAGLAADERTELVGQVLDAHATGGFTLVLVEHDMTVVDAMVDQVHVLDFGRLIATGTMAEVRANPAVVEAYLGTAAASPAS